MTEILLDQGCQCKTCSEILKKDLQEARNEWNNGKRKIIFRSYNHTCSDSCCSDYGTDVLINGFRVNCDADNTEYVIAAVLEFLEIEDVIVEGEYEEN